MQSALHGGCNQRPRQGIAREARRARPARRTHAHTGSHGCGSTSTAYMRRAAPSRDSMRQVPEKYFRSRDSTSEKQMSRTPCGGGPGERGTTMRAAALRELLAKDAATVRIQRQQRGARRARGQSDPEAFRGHTPLALCCGDAVWHLLNVQRGSGAELDAPRQLLCSDLRGAEACCSETGSVLGGRQAHSHCAGSGLPQPTGTRLQQAHAARPALQDAIFIQRRHNVYARSTGGSHESRCQREARGAQAGHAGAHAPARRS